MPNNKRPVSLFKGQNKGVNSPKSGKQNVAMSPYNRDCRLILRN